MLEKEKRNFWPKASEDAGAVPDDEEVEEKDDLVCLWSLKIFSLIMSELGPNSKWKINLV